MKVVVLWDEKECQAMNPWWEERSEDMAIYYVIDVATHPEKADRVLSVKKVCAKNPADRTR